jgi:hypothetical protein
MLLLVIQRGLEAQRGLIYYIWYEVISVELSIFLTQIKSNITEFEQLVDMQKLLINNILKKSLMSSDKIRILIFRL